MARIRTLKQSTAIRVVIAGRLGAADVGRLEHACSAGLISERAQLVVDLQRVTEIDCVADAHLRRIANRGAIIKRAT
jgi:hypothetical protein